MGSVKDVLGRWGKKMGEATRKAEDFAGNTWQHLNTSPSIADAALGRIAEETKVLAEGGHENIFRQKIEIVPEEQLKNSFACYLSTSASPVMCILYISTAKLAFCSDNPLSYQAGDKTEWSYYKVESLTNEEEVELRAKIEALGLEVRKLPSKSAQHLNEMEIAMKLDKLSAKFDNVDELISSTIAEDPEVRTLLSSTADVWMPVIATTFDERRNFASTDGEDGLEVKGKSSD